MPKIARCIDRLANFAKEYRDLPTVGYTHFQSAQFTTVGKRATLWILDLLEDEKDCRQIKEELKFRGIKGATGTQASFLQLFPKESAHEKVKSLDKEVTKMAGFNKTFPVTGNVYCMYSKFFNMLKIDLILVFSLIYIYLYENMYLPM